MEYNSFKKNKLSNQYDSSYEDYNQGIILYKKNDKKKRKYIACNNNGKVFYSDDEDENFYQNLNLINKYMNPKRKLSQNNVIVYKNKLQKKNSLINRYDFDEIINKPKESKKTKKNKRVHFLEDDFVKYIDVESYKKYNSLYTNKDSSLEDGIHDKAYAKCTCIIC